MIRIYTTLKYVLCIQIYICILQLLYHELLLILSINVVNMCLCNIHFCLYIVTGDANFSMESTSLTIGGFSQPSVARALIEQSGSTEIGLAQRILWIFPQPTYSRFSTLKPVDKTFTENLGKCILLCKSMHNRSTYYLLLYKMNFY